jgi:hypothetical protein
MNFTEKINLFKKILCTKVPFNTSHLIQTGYIYVPVWVFGLSLVVLPFIAIIVIVCFNL